MANNHVSRMSARAAWSRDSGRFLARMEASGSHRSSGLLLRAPPGQSEAKVLCEALGQLSRVARAITTNIRGTNSSLERILMDKADVEELQRILVNFSGK